MTHDELVQIALEMGADKAVVIPQEKISMSPVFRSICESNGCGRFNKCWMCAPRVQGEPAEVMAKVRSFSYGLWYQLIGDIEDSFDFEGMTEVGERHTVLSQKINEEMKKIFGKNMLHLGKGGCGLCKECTIKDNKPCRFPDKAISSLEMYCIDVSKTTAGTGLKYINGENTVTYFGIVLFND